MPSFSPRRLRRLLIWIVVVYFFAGTASQKLVPRTTEIFPFFGWSLFSRVPNLARAYTILIRQHDGKKLDPPLALLEAPPAMVTGDRYLARKVVQKIGHAQQRGDRAAVSEFRRVLESAHFQGEVRYILVVETYDPLKKWRTGEVVTRKRLGRFNSGEFR